VVAAHLIDHIKSQQLALKPVSMLSILANKKSRKIAPLAKRGYHGFAERLRGDIVPLSPEV
jgi:hypothetical protein